MKKWSDLTQSERLDRILKQKIAAEEVEVVLWADDEWKAFEISEDEVSSAPPTERE